MKVLKQILTALLMAAVLSLVGLTGGVVMGQKNSNRPPKDPEKIKEKDKPPPSNSNNSQGNSNRKKP